MLTEQVRLNRENQEQVLQTRMVAVQTIVPRIQRSVRQACRLAEKDVELECEGNRAVGEWDLKDPYYRQQVHPQPGYTAEQNARWYGVSPEEWIRGEWEDAANEGRYL